MVRYSIGRRSYQGSQSRKRRPAPRDMVEFSCTTRKYRDTVGILFPRGIVKRAGLQAGRKVRISLEV
ncbi:hypothetical protein HYS48_01870 [Candidatus Woesearchaeota archaeon]|nr:hypothetical protein [Candidatus Woesearchaeota archaeon]